MRKTTDIFNSGDHIDLHLTNGEVWLDKPIRSADNFGITVSRKENVIGFVPWTSIDYWNAFASEAPRRDVTPGFFDEEVSE